MVKYRDIILAYSHGVTQLSVEELYSVRAVLTVDH